MTENEMNLAVLILSNKDIPLIIGNKHTLIDDKKILKTELDYMTYIEDEKIIKSTGFVSYKAYVLSKVQYGDTFPTNERLKEEYEHLPWEQVLYVEVG